MSANVFSTAGDMFPKTVVATITGMGGMAGGVGALLINKSSGVLFEFSAVNNWKMGSFEGIKKALRIQGAFFVFLLMKKTGMILDVHDAMVP